MNLIHAAYATKTFASAVRSN